MVEIGVYLKFKDGEIPTRMTFAEARALHQELGQLFEPQQADVGRIVWARDAEGNSLSPEELKRRGDEFRDGKTVLCERLR